MLFMNQFFVYRNDVFSQLFHFVLHLRCEKVYTNCFKYSAIYNMLYYII